MLAVKCIAPTTKLKEKKIKKWIHPLELFQCYISYNYFLTEILAEFVSVKCCTHEDYF